jgi:hypothetical protein
VVAAAAGVRGLNPWVRLASLVVLASNAVLGLCALVGTAFLIRGAWAGCSAARPG